MNLIVARWILAFLPAFLVGAFEWWRHSLFDYMPLWLGNSLAAAVAVTGSVLYYKLTYTVIERLQAEVQSRRAREAVLRERERISRDLHDSLSQTLFFCNVELQTLERHLAAGNTAQAHAAAGEVREAVNSAYDQVRQAIFNLRLVPEQVAAAGQAPLRPALEQLLTEFSRQTGIQARLEGPDTGALPGSVREEVFRIVREALWNVRKHASAQNVVVTLRSGKEEWELSLQDDGTGFAPGAQPTGFGLQAMRERAREMGGRLEVQTAPGAGTVVRLTIPNTGGKDTGGKRAGTDR